MDFGSTRSPFAKPLRVPKQSAFSLVEIVLAIGIVAFAFVALLGLLPVGLKTFRDSIDTTNEGRIMQIFNAQVQASEYRFLKAKFDFEGKQRVYYFDEEASFLREGKPGFGELDPVQRSAAVYAAKLFVKEGWAQNEKSANSSTVIALLCPVASASFKQFDTEISDLSGLESAVKENVLKPQMRMRSLIIPRMDANTEKSKPANP